MKKLFPPYFVSFSVVLLFIALLMPVSLSAQPPIDTSTLNVGNVGWGPRKADPVRAYDTQSMELISNIYDTLISMSYDVYWNFEPRLATNVPTREDNTKTANSSDVNLTNPTGSHWTDGSTCVGWVDNNSTGSLDASDILYLAEAGGSYRTWRLQTLQTAPPVSVNLWRGAYIFHIRTSPTISYYNETGAVVDTFNISDAEYSLKRGLIQDQAGSPMWMFYEPLFGQHGSDPFNSNTTEPTATTLAHLIDNAVEINGNDLTINVGLTYPDNAFKETLSQAWGSIVSKEFSISIGCWNADLYSDSDADGYPDWWTTIRRIARSAYDTSGNFRYCGTGPYRVTLFDSVNQKVVLSRNPGYWRGWPAPGCGNVFSVGYVDTVQINYIADWDTRKAEFLNGTLDICAVPSTKMSELLNPATKEPSQPQIKTVKNLVSLTLSTAFFTFTIDPASAYIGSGHLPDGIPPDFFNNTHARKAFAYAFNRTECMKQPPFTESICRETPLVQGLYPDYHTSQTAYTASYSAAEAELKQAIFSGTNAWDAGFKMTLPYLMGHDTARIAFEQLKNFFANLSTYDGRTGPPFEISIVEYDPFIWPPDPVERPIWIIGWLADYADADNFIRPYMHSLGDFSYFQNYTAENGWGRLKDELIDNAVNTPDGPQRAAIYNQLEHKYIDDCPSIPLAQPLARMWMNYWVKGWYYNPLTSSPQSGYYYSIWKYDDCWFDNGGPTPSVSDGTVGMRDISFLILHFNAKAPDPTKPLDLKWVSVYGANGCIDPHGDRTCNMRDIQGAILHFNHKNNTLTP
jgi:peptide/nickel transport system substrate-binding protein